MTDDEFLSMIDSEGLVIDPCLALSIKAIVDRAAVAAQPEAGEAVAQIGLLSQREIKDAIRSAYDLGYNDSRNVRAVPGDGAPGYKGRQVEADHGGALIARLSVLASAPTIQPTQPVQERDPFEMAIDSFIEDYEMIGESEDGRDACYVPNDNDRALLKDAIMGLLGDTEWDRLWGEHIESLVAQRSATPPAQPEPVAKEFKELMGHLADVLDCDAFDKIDTAVWNAASRLIGIANLTKCATPAQAGDAGEPSDPLQGAVDWLSVAIERCDAADIQQRLSIGYNRARRLLDAAIRATKDQP